MKSTLTKYGFVGFLAGLLVFLFIFQFIDDLEESTHMILSYFCMFILTLLIIPAIKHEKHNVNSGQISFKRAFSIGIILSLFIGLGVGLADYLFTAVLEPDFIENYISKTLKTMEETLTVSEFEAQKTDFLAQMETFNSSSMMALFMIVNVLTIGLIVSIITSLTLKSKS